MNTRTCWTDTDTRTHLRNTVIDSIWTFACLATPQIPTNKNTRYCPNAKTHFRAVSCCHSLWFLSSLLAVS